MASVLASGYSSVRSSWVAQELINDIRNGLWSLDIKLGPGHARHLMSDCQRSVMYTRISDVYQDQNRSAVTKWSLGESLHDLCQVLLRLIASALGKYCNGNLVLTLAKQGLTNSCQVMPSPLK